MSDVPHTSNPDSADLNDDLLKGAPAIQKYTGIPARKLYYMLENNYLPGCFKLGNNWCGLKSEIVKGLRDRARPAA